jgi:predicted lactoylglutathione lyase
MALNLYMVGVVPRDMAASQAFYRSLGVDIPEGSERKPHVGVKMTGELTFFLNTAGVVDEADRPRTVFEFYLRERPAVDEKHRAMTALGYRSYREPFLSSFGIYFAMIEDPDGNIVLLSAD